jgi:hypothetical protein
MGENSVCGDGQGKLAGLPGAGKRAGKLQACGTRGMLFAHAYAGTGSQATGTPQQ